jgi:hypothetical protein
MKRYLIFKSRFMIAIFSILIPFLVQAILSYLIPSSSSMITDLFNTIFNRKSIKEYDFSLNKYGHNNFVFSADSGEIAKQFQLYHNRVYPPNNSSVNFIDLSNEKIKVNDYVLRKRIENMYNLLNDFFIGVDFSYEYKSKSIIANMFYSKMAYHTSATILSEINNFMFSFYTNDSTRSIQTINKPIVVIPNEASSMQNNKNIDVINCLEVMPFSFLDFIEGIIIAFVISLSTIHITRENRNGSKSLQLLSGTHYVTYWFSNYIFDYAIHYINITSLIIALKMVIYFVKDEANDTFLIAEKNSTLFNLYLFLLLTSLSWSTLSYLWSFKFKSDIIAFISLFMVLSFASLLDMILVFIKFFDQFNRQIEFGVGRVTILCDLLRDILTILCPNVAAKRATFNLKIQNSKICLMPLNLLFNSKFVIVEIITKKFIIHRFFFK